jgi:pimeloyl-ACP methyl ester carboxylesterase
MSSSTLQPLTTTARDGTRIGYFRSGSGPPLVLIHGTTADHTRWAPVLPELIKRFTVFAVDRRGRGASSDAPVYELEREFEDVAAVVDAAGQSVFLLGHSYGAACSLEAALLTDRLAKLVLYEPPIPTGIPIYPPGAADALDALIERGERESVVVTFFRDVARMTPAELDVLRALPNWPARIAAAHTIPREMRIAETYTFRPERFAGFDTPTLLLLGGDSPPFLKAATEAAHRALESSRIAVMPGQGHAAMNTAPDLFLREVMGFLGE